MALRWKKNPRPTGLSAVGCGPQGHTLRDGEEVYANVAAIGGDWRGPLKGWYWYGCGQNTCSRPVPDEKTAKREAMDYVRAWIKSNPKD